MGSSAASSPKVKAGSLGLLRASPLSFPSAPAQTQLDTLWDETWTQTRGSSSGQAQRSLPKYNPGALSFNWQRDPPQERLSARTKTLAGMVPCACLSPSVTCMNVPMSPSLFPPTVPYKDCPHAPISACPPPMVTCRDCPMHPSVPVPPPPSPAGYVPMRPTVPPLHLHVCPTVPSPPTCHSGTLLTSTSSPCKAYINKGKSP